MKWLARLLTVSSLVIPTAAFAQIGSFGGPADGGPKVTIEGTIQKKSGDSVEGTIVAKIAETWHINSHKPLDELLIPTELTLDPVAAMQPKYPQHVEKAFGFSGGAKLAVYEGTFTIPFTATVKPGATKLSANLHYQACNDQVCLPPNDATTEIDLAKVVAVEPTSSANFTPLSEAPKDAGKKVSLLSGDVGGIVSSYGMGIALLALFLGGLALNLTPCVFPMIPITLGFFALQSDGRRSRRFALSAMYALGIVAMYSTLGVLASLGGKLVGAWLQLPAVLIGFALLMIVLASSMFGAFDIGVPAFIANRAQGRAGLVGAMTMGLLVGIVAAPCVGPVVVALITFVASIGKPSVGLMMFAALGLGLAFPYLALLNALPRPGEWMVHVKKAMGFVLVAMAIYFLRPILGDDFFRWGVTISLLLGALFLFFRRSSGPSATQVTAIRLACAIVLLVAGAAFAIPRGGDGKSLVRWDRYDDSALAAAAKSGKPVVIDAYADWCLPCKELDKNTFNDQRVADELDRFVRVKVDLTTSSDPRTVALTKQYAIVGVPTIIFLDPQGQERKDLRLTGFEEADKFLARAQQLR